MSAAPEVLTPIAEYSPTAAAIADLKDRFGGLVLDVSTGKGMTQAKEARAELRGYRVALEAKRVEIKAPALERCRLIDAEAKRITAEITALEEPIDATIKAEEQRKEREKEAKAAAEAERVARQNAWFDEVRALPLGAMNLDAAGIRELLAKAEAVDAEAAPVGPENLSAAKHTRQLTINTLKAALDARSAADAEAAKVAAQLAELAELKAEQAAREAAAREAEEAARRQREEAEAAERAEREAAERAQREAEAAEREAERQRLADERAALEAAEAARREQIAREDRERREQQAREDAERAAAAAAEQAERERQRRELEAQQAELARQKVAKRIATTGLFDAARDALELLNEVGQADHIVTQTLASAIAREPKAKAA